MPVGLWNRSTAVSTLFTFWPPAPLARAVVSSMSCAACGQRGRAGDRVGGLVGSSGSLGADDEAAGLGRQLADASAPAATARWVKAR